MRRILFVLTVAALMAAMMISAGPAQANDTNFGNSSNFVQVGNGLFGVGDIGFGHHCCHNGFDFGDNDNDISVGFGGFSIEQG